MCNDIFDKLSESELGIYVMTDSDADLVGRVKQIGYKSGIPVKVYHLHYSDNVDLLGTEFVRERFDAVHDLFKRWDAKGYNTRKAKLPFGCKAFSTFLESINLLQRKLSFRVGRVRKECHNIVTLFFL